ncbi:hypothetical protein [Legionella sp.]|uniref:hypothetical protein n=1 Tax=Legionella sp. TaxID=459 RepID=UPI003C9B0FF7
MVNIKNEQFIQDKNQFFAQHRVQHISAQIEDVNLLVSNDYKFLLENQITIEAELTQMFAVLKKEKEKNNEVFWVYCYYCASLLESFYKAYSHQKNVKHYQQLKQQIKDHLLKEKKKQEEEKSFIQYFEQSIIDGFRNLKEAPFQISAIRDFISYSNLCRLYWVFCRLTLTNGFLLAEELQCIEKIDAILGIHTDVDKIIATLEAPNKVLNYFSVGLFLARFIIDAGLLIRHTFFPTEAEARITAFERFKYELYKRQCNFANDLVWASINFLTNFNHITNISVPVAGSITTVFLGFDVSMAFYKRHLAKQEYLNKNTQYLQEIGKYKEITQSRDLTDDEKMQQIMLKKQCEELEIDWQTKEATFYFLAGAAALLMLGFTSALIFSPPGIVVSSFFLCVFASAMYFSADTYSQYKENSLRLQLEGQNRVEVDKRSGITRNDFILTLGKNTLLPTVLITAFATYWPVAIVLTALYIGYQSIHAMMQHKKDTKETKQLTIDPENYYLTA